MYRALYDYKTELKNYLAFETGDQFTVIDSKQKDWYLAQNGYGEIGYIPKNYVVREEVGQSEVLLSIDRAIEVIHYQAGSKGGQYTHPQRENLSKLIQHRKSVVENYKDQPKTSASQQDDGVQLRNKSIRRVAPAPPSRISSIENKSREPAGNKTDNRNSTSDTEVNKVEVNENHQNCVQQGLEPGNRNSRETVDCASSPVNFPQNDKVPEETKCDQSGLVNLSAINFPECLGSELVEEVRKNTSLSYQNSMVAVETVLGHIAMTVPEISPFLDKIFANIHMSKSDQVEEEISSDYERLRELFNELAECKDDSQQRGWALHEDESIINGNLEELLSILENAKQSVTRAAIAGDSYECVYNLVQYYQMEIRVPLRLSLLKIFNAMCVLDAAVISQLLFSILTTELADELQRNIDDIQRSSYVSLALAMLFSTGDPAVPAHIHDHLNMDFLRFIFDVLENPPTPEHEEHLSDLLVNFVLAYNLHFQKTDNNLVMKVIAEKTTVKTFSEKILLLFNRGDDPVVMFDHEPHPPNSVMKLLQDMYSDPCTSTVIYTNDERVLVDIILGHLVDLSPGDKNRTTHLKLMQLFLHNSKYTDYKHRVTELNDCLKRILNEEEDTVDDKHIISDIFKHSTVFTM